MIGKKVRSLPGAGCWCILLMQLVFSGGCVVRQIGSTIEQTIRGDYYLQSEQVDKGRSSFKNDVEKNPGSALAHYYYGRFLLKDNERKMALAQLQQAADLDPNNADYHFWTGIAYGATGNKAQEEKSYRQALLHDSKHLQSIIYLGHTQLEKNRLNEALKLYSRALGLWPESPAALYNRALIMNKLGRSPEEKLAWQHYLLRYPSGAMARRATDYLNKLGDFSFRNHALGARTITIEKIRFEPFRAGVTKDSRQSLDLVGSVFANMTGGRLQIVVYQKNNKELAHRRAVAVKNYLLQEFSTIPARRIGVSWFDQPQIITPHGHKVAVAESVSFFITDK